MAASGWTAPFLIYPSLPQNDDLNLFVKETRKAWADKRGMWSEFGEDVLLGYEYRMCIKLAAQGSAAKPFDAAASITEAFQRICVDLATMTEVGKFGFHHVDPPNRLWFWATDTKAARIDLRLG
jgi:hypothetical protein